MLINNRFEVNPSRGEVTDLQTNKLVRLEPRLMKLLCLLIENKGQPVTREIIITNIWDDYPGAGEGLNQAISGLRKILGDEKKQLIETLPKKGYCFRGSAESLPTSDKKNSVNTGWLISGIILFLIAVLMLLYFYSGSRRVQGISLEEQKRVSKLDSARQAERLKESKH